MPDLEAEQLEDEQFYAEIEDAAQVVRATEQFREVMPPLVDRLFDADAQRRAVEYLTSPLLQEATVAFNRRWAETKAGDAA
ncbi:hypothetical protein [Agromyces bauzanensis]